MRERDSMLEALRARADAAEAASESLRAVTRDMERRVSALSEREAQLETALTQLDVYVFLVACSEVGWISGIFNKPEPVIVIACRARREADGAKRDRDDALRRHQTVENELASLRPRLIEATQTVSELRTSLASRSADVDRLHQAVRCVCLRVDVC